MSKLAKLALATSLAIPLASATLAGIATPEDIDTLRSAVSRYHDINVAKAEGFEQLFECTEHAELGSMGVHFLHTGRTGDGELVLTEPEVLMYEPMPDGSMQLIGVEFVVFEKDWEGDSAPVFLGKTLQRKTSVGRHEVDPFYELHVWSAKGNTSGAFADWNPDVTCDHFVE
jgi:hypothetical protein